MGVSWEEQARVQQLLTDAVMVLCKNSLKYESKFCIEGLFGITIDDSDILLVNIKESMNGALGSSAAGMSHSPAQSMVRSPAMSRMNSFRGRSPMGIGAQRMALTSPRRGRAKQITSTRGRSPQIGNRKRALFSSPLKTAHMQQQPMTLPRMSSPQHSMPMPLPDQSGLPEGPPNKMRRPSQAKVEPFNPDDVIEIGDEDEGVAHTTQSSKTETNQVKQEVPDLPSSSTDHSETKFTLDGESNKSLTDFLDNLMSQHDVGHGQSSEQMIPKTEPFDPSSSFPHLSGQASGAFGSPQHAQNTFLKVKSEQGDVKPFGMGNQYAQVGRGRSPSRATSDMMTYTSQIMGDSPLKKESLTPGAGKTYQCPKCDREFTQKSHFFGHMNSHLSVRPYSCDKCGKGFAYSQNLARHQKSCFTPSKHSCNFCGISLANAQELQMHLITSHADSM